MSRMASSSFAVINWRARSWRCSRSSRVIGLASSFRDFRRASAGGKVRSAFVSGSPEATRGEAAMAATPPTWRNRRRETMQPPMDKNGHYRVGSGSANCQFSMPIWLRAPRRGHNPWAQPHKRQLKNLDQEVLFCGLESDFSRWGRLFRGLYQLLNPCAGKYSDSRLLRRSSSELVLLGVLPQNGTEPRNNGHHSANVSNGKNLNRFWTGRESAAVSRRPILRRPLAAISH